MSKTTVGVKLDEETRARLRDLGESRQRSPHWLMTEAITRFLDIEERFEREKLEDRERWERYVESDTHVTNEEMTARLEDLATRAAEKVEAE